MKATVNKNIELISIIHYLMNYNDIVGFPLISDKKNIYTENIDNYFSAYKNHDFFNLYKVLIKKDFIFDAPIIFSYNFDFSIQESEANKIDYSNFRLSQTDFYTLLNSLKEFSNNVNYLHFYESQSQMYSEISRNIQNLMISTNINNELEDFYGYSFGDCEIIVSPLNNGNYGLKIFLNKKQQA
ncbi:MAG: DUF4932 domain-containing protein [Candidatus Delongbacteria bacterium]|nr:DUF4932 domain-containing protein [Candidatus Delongbacteria bacterium]